MKEKIYKCGIFDLDGVLVDTAKYHYLAWKQLAAQLGFEFTRTERSTERRKPDAFVGDSAGRRRAYWKIYRC